MGKYLMWDAGVEALGLFDHPLNEYKGVMVTRVIHDHYRADSKRGFYGGGGIDARLDYYPAGFALNGLPPEAPRWGSEFKKTFEAYYTRTMALLSHTTSLAQHRNTISLDPDVKDAWGLPAIRVTFDFHPDDLATLHYMLKKQVEILEAAGARKIWTQAVELENMLPSAHLMGTCRMGNESKTSVVNAFSRAHDVPNLFIVDGSNLVTSGRQQPTATIQALAYRAAEHAMDMARRGELLG